MGGVALVYSLAAVLGALMRRYKLPLLVGFLLAGLLTTKGVLNQDAYMWIKHAAEYGAAFLMFAVGMELDLKHFRGLGWTIFWMALLQMFMFVMLGFGFLILFNYSLASAIVFSMVVAFSSTILVASVLRDKRELHSLHGRVLIGVLILQDLITIGLIFVIPFLKDLNWEWQKLSTKVILNVLVILAVMIVGRWLFRRIKIVFKTDYDSVFVLSVAYLMSVIFLFSLPWIDLPAEIAGLTAGLSLATVFARDRIVLWFEPIKDYFMVYLFFYVGMQVDPSWFWREWQLILILGVVVVGVKSFIGWITAGVAGFPRKVILLTGLGLANMSELGFVILPMSLRLGIIDERSLAVFSMLILISIFVSALFLYNSNIFSTGVTEWFGLLERTKVMKPDGHMYPLKDKKVLIGCDRSGRAIVKNLSDKRDLVVLDYDMNTIRMLRKKKINAMYCDAVEKKSLQELGLDKAKMILSTLPDWEDNLVVADFVSDECSANKKPWMVFLARNQREMSQLYKAGVNLVLNPYLSVADEFLDIMLSNQRGLLAQKIKRRQKNIYKFLR